MTCFKGWGVQGIEVLKNNFYFNASVAASLIFPHVYHKYQFSLGWKGNNNNTTGYKESDIFECLFIISIHKRTDNWLLISILNHHEYTVHINLKTGI